MLIWSESQGWVTAELHYKVGDYCHVGISLSPSRVVEGVGADLFEALKQARLILESQELRTWCEGAKVNVHPSSMQRQSVYGLYAYRVGEAATGDRPPVVNIFEDAGITDAVGTVAEQQKWFENWMDRDYESE